MKIKFNLFILYFLNSFVINSKSEISEGYINILQDSKIAVSQTIENNEFSINNLFNDEENMYNYNLNNYNY